MPNGDGKTLWSTADRSRYFLIPAGQSLPSGAFELREAGGRAMKCDAQAVAQYEISAEQANVRLRGALSLVFDGARQVVADLVARGAAGAAGAPGGAGGAVPSDKVARDFDVVKRGLRDLFASFVEAARDASEKTAAAPATAATGGDTPVGDTGVASAASSVTEAAARSGEALATKVKAFLGSAELEQIVRAAATRLQSLADDLQARREGPPAPADGADKPKQ